MKDLYVVNCCRTAIGSFGGSLKNTPCRRDGRHRGEGGPQPRRRRSPSRWMRSCSAASSPPPWARTSPVRSPSRPACPYSVPAYTVGMVCGSGMKSVIEGARAILAGDADIVVCRRHREHVRRSLCPARGRPLGRPHG